MTDTSQNWLSEIQALTQKAKSQPVVLPEASAPQTIAPETASTPVVPARQTRRAPIETGEVDPLVPSCGSKVFRKRDYQISAVQDVIRALTEDARRVLLVSPTGSGKNHMTAMLLAHEDLRAHFGVPKGEELRVMYFAHKHELLQQGVDEIGGVPGVKLIPQSIFSGIPDDILAKGWHFSIHDEAHHEPMMSFQQKLGYISDAQMLGLTATPERADKFSLKFDEIIVAITREEAVEKGYLAPATVHSVVDMGAMNKPELLSDLIDGYGDRMERTLVYLKTKDQAVTVHRMLLRKGYRSAVLVNVTKTQRDKVKEAFEAGDLDFVVNCQMLDEGVDFKGVKGVIIARGVQSGPLLNQIIGRAARIDEPECHIWQFVDPLRDNLDACSIVGRDVDHFLYYIRGGQWHCDRMASAVMVDDTEDEADGDAAAHEEIAELGVACA